MRLETQTSLEPLLLVLVLVLVLVLPLLVLLLLSLLLSLLPFRCVEVVVGPFIVIAVVLAWQNGDMGGDALMGDKSISTGPMSNYKC